MVNPIAMRTERQACRAATDSAPTTSSLPRATCRCLPNWEDRPAPKPTSPTQRHAYLLKSSCFVSVSPLLRVKTGSQLHARKDFTEYFSPFLIPVSPAPMASFLSESLRSRLYITTWLHHHLSTPEITTERTCLSGHCYYRIQSHKAFGGNAG